MVLFALLYLFVLLLFDSSVKGNNPFITYHNENISEACYEEALKQRAEERFRSKAIIRTKTVDRHDLKARALLLYSPFDCGVNHPRYTTWHDMQA